MKTVLSQQTQYDISPSHLKKGSIFGALSDSAIYFLLENGVLHEAKKDDEVFAYDSKGGSFYAVLHGNLDFYKHHDDRITRTRTIQFGEAIGFVSMIALHERVGTLYALEECLLLEISSLLFSDLHDQYAFDFGILLMNLSRDMARTIRVLSDDLVDSDQLLKEE